MFNKSINTLLGTVFVAFSTQPLIAHSTDSVITVYDAAEVAEVISTSLEEGQGARLYYTSKDCSKTVNDVIGKVNIREVPISKNIIHLTSGRSYKVLIVKGAPTKFYIGQVDTKLLSTKLDKLYFDLSEQYNGFLAIGAIENSDQFREAVKILAPGKPPRFSSGIGVSPNVKSPRLPPSMSNLTVDQVLDEIANTFRGVVVYASCPSKQGFSIEVISNTRFFFPENILTMVNHVRITANYGDRLLELDLR